MEKTALSDVKRMTIKYSLWVSLVAVFLHLLFSPFVGDVFVMEAGLSLGENMFLFLRYISTLVFIRFPALILILGLLLFALYNLKGLRKDINKLFYLAFIYMLYNVFETTAEEKPLEAIDSTQGGAFFIASVVLFFVITAALIALIIRLDKKQKWITAGVFSAGLVILAIALMSSGSFIPVLIAKIVFTGIAGYVIWRVSCLVFGYVMKDEPTEELSVLSGTNESVVQTQGNNEKAEQTEDERTAPKIGAKPVFLFIRLFVILFAIGFIVINSLVTGEHFNATRVSNDDDFVTDSEGYTCKNNKYFFQGGNAYIDINVPDWIEQVSVFFYTAPGEDKVSAFILSDDGSEAEAPVRWNSTKQFITVDLANRGKLRLAIDDNFEIDYLYFADHVPADKYKKYILFAVLFLISAATSAALSFIKKASEAYIEFEKKIFDLPIGIAEIFKKPKGEKLKHAFTERFEIIGALLIFLLASVYCFTEKPYFGYCTDDYNHYNRAAQVSYLLNGSSDVTDYEVYIEHLYRSLTVDKEELIDKHIAFYGDMNELHYYTDANFYTGLKALPYIPSAAGLILTRGLGMPWNIRIVFGRWMMTWFFAAICYFSMKVLKKRKLVVFLVGIIPTNIYFAANYNYDLWLTGFMMLGICMYMIEAYDERSTLSISTAVMMPLFIAMGNIAKSVYFPMMFFVLFLSRRKFKNTLSSLLYRFYVMIMMVLPVVFLYFNNINIGGSIGSGDFRGGSDVDATLQMQFFLEQPMKVLGIIFRFLGDYLNPAVTGKEYITYLVRNSMSYNASIVILLIILLAVATNSDVLEKENSSEAIRWWYRLGTVLEYAGIGFLAAFSMYINFTGVGYERVDGCVGRYLIPMLFPMLFVLTAFSVRRIKEIKTVIKKDYNDILPAKSHMINMFAVIFLVFINLDLMIFGVFV